MASIITATPAALSAAPVPVCQESMCAPSITISSALLVPRISAMVLWPGWSVSSVKRASTLTRSFTGCLRSSARASWL